MSSVDNVSAFVIALGRTFEEESNIINGENNVAHASASKDENISTVEQLNTEQTAINSSDDELDNEILEEF
jgi:hypothetical protein